MGSSEPAAATTIGTARLRRDNTLTSSPSMANPLPSTSVLSDAHDRRGDQSLAHATYLRLTCAGPLVGGQRSPDPPTRGLSGPSETSKGVQIGQDTKGL